MPLVGLFVILNMRRAIMTGLKSSFFMYVVDIITLMQLLIFELCLVCIQSINSKTGAKKYFSWFLAIF